jgi:hypothetical protein
VPDDARRRAADECWVSDLPEIFVAVFSAVVVAKGYLRGDPQGVSLVEHGARQRAETGERHLVDLFIIIMAFILLAGADCQEE